MVRNAQTKNSIWNLDACEKETALQFNKNGKHGKLWFWVSCWAVFLAVKSMKNPVFFAREENSKKTIKSVLENHYFPLQISLNHA